MKQRIGVFATSVFSATLVFLGDVQACSGGSLLEDLTITVQVHRSAKVSRTTLERAQAVASQIFREAGIELKWVDCPCEVRRDRTTVALRILPKLFGSAMSRFRSDHLGFAAVTEDGGVLASVFYDRIESLGKGGDLSGLLGLATAHEIGHLFLGSKAHSKEGIMQPQWTRKQLRRANLHQFRFTSEQAEALRERAAGYHTQERAADQR